MKILPFSFNSGNIDEKLNKVKKRNEICKGNIRKVSTKHSSLLFFALKSISFSVCSPKKKKTFFPGNFIKKRIFFFADSQRRDFSFNRYFLGNFVNTYPRQRFFLSYECLLIKREKKLEKGISASNFCLSDFNEYPFV